MENFSRSQRRFDEKRVQKRRVTMYAQIWEWLIMTKKNQGRLKHNHFGCGCSMCKNWKHTGEKYSFKERAKYEIFTQTKKVEIGMD